MTRRYMNVLFAAVLTVAFGLLLASCENPMGGCAGGKCDDNSAECDKDGDCDDGETCQGGDCVPESGDNCLGECEECRVDADCSGKTPYCNEGQCSEFCLTAAQCEDGKKFTVDSCVDGECVSVELPCAGEWNVLGECVIQCEDADDGNLCTVDTCDAETGEAVNMVKPCEDNDSLTADACDPRTGDCHHVVESLCDFEDNNPCTMDSCDPDTGAAIHVQFDCDDDDPFTAGTCRSEGGFAFCVFTPICTPDDGNPCTVDSCGVDGEPVHVDKSCTDNKDWTRDWCDPTTGDCHHDACNINCSDDDACTRDGCDTLTGECTHESVECGDGSRCVAGTCIAWCERDADCDDGNACTLEDCDLSSGQCSRQSVNCADNDPHTRDWCQSVTALQYTCVHDPTACFGGCDDANACTVDYCDETVQACRHEPIGGACGEGTVCDQNLGRCIPAPCRSTDDCDDGNACTFDYCDAGLCVFRDDVACNADQICDPATAQCVPRVVHVDECPPCDDDELCDPQAGVCYNPCDAGTIWDPQTGTCRIAQADAECIPGGVECVLFEDAALVAVAQCVNGHWFQLESCGLFSMGANCVYDRFGQPQCE